MRKFILLVCIIFIPAINGNFVFASNVDNYNSQIVKIFRNYVCMQHRGRAVLYNALGLSDAQILERECIAAQFATVYDEKLDQLYKEAQRLDAFERVGCSAWQIYCQRRLLEKYRKEILSLLDNENRMFAKCLTKEQYKKFKEILAIKGYEYKHICREKDYYKSNPKMKAFGNPKPCPTPISRAE